MSDILLKYRQLSEPARQELNDFIDFLLSRQRKMETKSTSDYKKKILNVSAWSDEDLKVFDKNAEIFNQWKATEW